MSKRPCNPTADPAACTAVDRSSRPAPSKHHRPGAEQPGECGGRDEAARAAEVPHAASPTNACAWLLAESLVLAVRLYQRTLGLVLGGHCRFYPSCSNYFILAVRKHGPLKGALKGIGRILRCHPFHPGGFDEP